MNTIERHDIVSTDEILQRADEVMYEYKRKHKEKYLKQLDRKSTRLNSSHTDSSRMPSSA